MPALMPHLNGGVLCPVAFSFESLDQLGGRSTIGGTPGFSSSSSELGKGFGAAIVAKRGGVGWGAAMQGRQKRSCVSL